MDEATASVVGVLLIAGTCTIGGIIIKLLVDWLTDVYER